MSLLGKGEQLEDYDGEDEGEETYVYKVEKQQLV